MKKAFGARFHLCGLCKSLELKKRCKDCPFAGADIHKVQSSTLSTMLLRAKEVEKDAKELVHRLS